MRAQEVPAVEWAPFLEQFGRDHRGWLATVERAQRGRSPEIEVRERPLIAIVSESRADRVVDIQFHFHPDLQPTDQIHVSSPRAVYVELNDDGAAQGMEIENARGERVHVRFRGALPEGLLMDGVAPSEL
jgi:Family of unknown function (DUF5335)